MSVAIEKLYNDGAALLGRKDFDEAHTRFSEAFHLLPEPKEKWPETKRIVAALGDALFRQGEYMAACDAFRDAVRLPSGLGDAFIHLRLGECFYEVGDRRRAADNLARAYMGGGREVFSEEDPKYFRLVESVLKPPAGMDRLP